MNKGNEDKENPMKNQLVTKEQIRKYLRLYPTLQSRIRQWELYHIKYAPSLDEWRENRNTIENQVIAMEEDKGLQKLKFYKQSLDRHLYLLKINHEAKCYNYLLWKYMKDLPEKELIKRLGFATKEAMTKFDNEIIEYLYTQMKKEAENNG